MGDFCPFEELFLGNPTHSVALLRRPSASRVPCSMSRELLVYKFPALVTLLC